MTTCMLYCVFRRFEHDGQPHPLGVDGQPVFLLSGNGLTAAVSKSGRLMSAPDITTILHYKRVVDFFYAKHTVVPMRYGCLFDEESQVLNFFQNQEKKYEELLEYLEGCVEMGIRALVVDSASRPSNGKSAQNNFTVPGSETEDRDTSHETPGKAFLVARKAHYFRENNLLEKFEDIRSRCRETFDGLFRDWTSENDIGLCLQPSIKHHLLSLYFLVPKKSMKAFQTAFQCLSHTTSHRLLMSGPWPPYNFVLNHQCSDKKNSHLL